MIRKLSIALTVLMAGRMMTLAFIHRAGLGGAGDPPAAWLMPLIGDAVIGALALVVAYLLATRRSSAVWLAAVMWNALGLWDALSAYVVSSTNPWPEFFMLELMGPMMFFAAAGMHLLLLVALLHRQTRGLFLPE